MFTRAFLHRAKVHFAAQAPFGSHAMSVVYFKRFRMEYDLAGPLFPEPEMPPDYSLLAWDDRLLEAHAETKYRSFKWEMDANVFPCLGERDGCRRLMTEIVRRTGFVPEATWLLQHWRRRTSGGPSCAARSRASPTPASARSRTSASPQPTAASGLGSVLLWHSLAGFKRAGIDRVYLEVSADNTGACRLYERLGFRRTKVVYKASEVAFAEW